MGVCLFVCYSCLFHHMQGLSFCLFSITSLYAWMCLLSFVHKWRCSSRRDACFAVSEAGPARRPFVEVKRWNLIGFINHLPILTTTWRIIALETGQRPRRIRRSVWAHQCGRCLTGSSLFKECTGKRGKEGVCWSCQYKFGPVCDYYVCLIAQLFMYQNITKCFSKVCQKQ